MKTAAQRVQEWRERNPGCRSREYQRVKAKDPAAPPWVDSDLIKDLYTYAAIMRSAGVDCHVDHEVPLQGRNVCGLHTHHNLTVIDGAENVRKSNTFQADWR